MGLLDGRVAFVTGAARGQGRNHAVRLAREGAHIIAIDIAGAASPDNGYPPAPARELDDTVTLIEAVGAQVLADIVDVRDSDQGSQGLWWSARRRGRQRGHFELEPILGDI